MLFDVAISEFGVCCGGHYVITSSEAMFEIIDGSGISKVWVVGEFGVDDTIVSARSVLTQSLAPSAAAGIH